MSQYIQFLSPFLNLLLGGGFLITLITLRSQKKKAGAEAKGAEATAKRSELDNVEEAITIWREMAVEMKTQRDEAVKSFIEVTKQVAELKELVQKLNSTNARIVKLLDRLKPDNLDKLIAEIKHEIQGNA